MAEKRIHIRQRYGPIADRRKRPIRPSEEVMGTMSVAVVLIVADRPLRPLAAIPSGGKHETESGHLGSAVDSAAMPRTRSRRPN